MSGGLNRLMALAPVDEYGRPLDPDAPGSPVAQGPAVVAVLGRVAHGLADPFVLAHDVYQGRTDPMSQEGISRALGLATTLATGGMPMAEAGAAGVFGGRLSATANREALAEAQAQAAMGIGRRDIWNETGWFQGPDHQWRYEIPDQATRYSGHGPALGHGLDHPQAYQAYPGLNAVEHQVMPRLQDDSWGLYYRPSPEGAERIEIARSSRGEALSAAKMHDTALHEMQHAIQVREGTLQSSPTQVADYINDLRQRMQSGYQLTGKEADPAAFQRWKDLKYWQNPAEVEARNVERRRLWSDAERQSVPPWESADHPWAQPDPSAAYPAATSGANSLMAASGAQPSAADINRLLLLMQSQSR